MEYSSKAHCTDASHDNEQPFGHVFRSMIWKTITIYFVNRIRKMVSFELGKEIEKDVFNRLVTIVGQEKILSPHEETNLRH